MDLLHFTPVASLLGGVLIALAAALLLLTHGRIAGISGILGVLSDPRRGDAQWRLVFLLGLVIGGLVASQLWPERFASGIERSSGAVAIAGLLVGFGTRMGSGCTSGHGVCGIGRFSRRSIAATVMFMATGMATAAVITHGFGGAL